MADDTPIISYERLVERALRGVLREALELTVREGLPGQHHFFITFHTQHPEVVIPSYLKATYPEEMTIVLQHQFWNLTVTPTWFEVGLAFKGKTEMLHIPFEAVTAFADPFARFGLQFQIDLDGDEDSDLDEDEDGADADDQEQDARQPSPPVDPASKVVTLDAFRKK